MHDHLVAVAVEDEYVAVPDEPIERVALYEALVETLTAATLLIELVLRVAMVEGSEKEPPVVPAPTDPQQEVDEPRQ